MERSRLITIGGMIDGSGAGLRRDVTLAIEDGIIVSMNEGRQPPQGATSNHLPHCLLLPPLIDASLLLARSPSVAEPDGANSPGDRAALVARHLGYCHAHGVLGLAVGDHPAEVAPAWRDWGYDKGLLELRVAISASQENDGDFLRLRLSADIDDRQADQFRPSPDLTISLTNPGKKKVVVANGAEAVAKALAAGCDAIEQGYAMGEDNLRTMAERGVVWIPSLVRAKNGVDGASGGGDIACRFSQRYVAPGQPVPGAEALWRKTLAG